MISSRYVLPVVLLLALALIPTVIHSYLESKADDGLLASRISPLLDGATGKPTERNKRWGQDVFASQDWIERIYKRPQRTGIRLFVARSYDHKRLYHHPELGLSYGSDLKGEGVVILPGKSEIPVHLLRERRGSGLVAYALLYDEKFVADPIAQQIRSSFNLLFNASKPMTLFYVSVPNSLVNRAFDESPPARLMRAAIESFLSQIAG